MDTPISRATPAAAGSSAIRLTIVPLWRNWVSYFGLLIAALSLFCFFFLLYLDIFAQHGGNPYIGVAAYLIAPSFGAIGCAIFVAGMVIMRILRRGKPAPTMEAEAGKPADLRKIAAFIGVAFVLTVVSAFASYRSYQYTESVEFCGTACHDVMKPEYTTYQHSPHARVACSECHIGSGAEWYVRAKVNGLHQVYALATETYQKPVKTPIKNMRIAQDTCEHCHWPSRYVGNVDKTFRHFLSEDDNDNKPWSIRMVLKVGGNDPNHGPVGGIHWHMNAANKVEYIATDEQRQTIPWVRLTDADGKVTEYRSPDFKDDPAKFTIRKMDCMDCHNRPAHQFQSPGEAVDMRMSQNLISPRLSHIKAEAVELLNKEYATREDALAQIETQLKAKHPNDPLVTAAIEQVQDIYRLNYFPEMKSSWIAYPVNIGHKNFPGCMRCHDGDHTATAEPTKSIAKDCKVCHETLAQGTDMDTLTPGIKFKHPGGSMGDQQCYECHNEKWADARNGKPADKKPEKSESSEKSTK